MADYINDFDPSLADMLEGFDAASSAILVIDETGDIDPTLAGGVVAAAVSNTERILAAARAAGSQVIFCEDAHIEGVDKELELWGPHGIAGTDAAQTTASLSRGNGDYTVHKRRYSAFFGTDLDLYLRERGIKSLVLCGLDTNICVAHTAADAFYNMYDLYVISDATATFLIGNQEDGLQFMKTCYGAKVVTTDELLTAI